MHRRKRRAGDITNIVDARLKVLKIFILRATHPHCCARAYGPSFSASASFACPPFCVATAFKQRFLEIFSRGPLT